MKAMNVGMSMSDYSKFVEVEQESVDGLLSKKHLMKPSIDYYMSSPDHTHGVEDLKFIEDTASSIIHDNSVSSDFSKLIHSILPEKLTAHDSIKSELKELDLFLLSSSEDAASLSDAFRSTGSECSCNVECCKDLIETIHDVFSGMMAHWFV